MSRDPRQEVTAAIVNYGCSIDTLSLAADLAPQVNRVIVVDNSNDIDGNDPAIAHIRLISPPSNIGFGAAVNRAAAETATRWLLVLNPDVRLRDGCLDRLLEASSDLQAPVCGPRFFWDEDCTLQLPPALGHPLWMFADRNFPNRNPVDMPNLSALAVIRHERFWQEQAPFSEPVLSGACLLVDNHWFRRNQMPIFDEDFFLYYEDTDLCGRLMRKGVMPVCVAGADAVHYWNQSSEPPEGKAALMRASEKIFLQKYYPNGAPALPPAPSPEAVEDLGRFAQPPVVALPGGTRHVDIGVQDDFIVFVRANTRKKTFTFTGSMWDRIRDGDYFMRASDASGDVLKFWHWSK